MEEIENRASAEPDDEPSVPRLLVKGLILGVLTVLLILFWLLLAWLAANWPISLE